MKTALVTSCFISRDGVGNTIRDKLDAFAAWGWQSSLYHQQSLNELPAGYSGRRLELVDLIAERAGDSGNGFFSNSLYLVQFLIYYPLMEVCRFIHNGRLIIEYPGITPPELFPQADPFFEFTGQALEHLELLDFADRILVHSEYMKGELLSLRDMPPERVSVVPLGVSEAFVRADAIEHRSVRRRQDSAAASSLTAANSPLLLYVGRLAGNKRVDLLVKALARVRAKHPGARLALVGPFARSTAGFYETDLRNLVGELALRDAVEFVGEVDEATLVSWYLKADIFVTASLHEGFCLPVAEAMSCGLPAVVPGCTATPETMGRGGVTCTPGDEVDLARIVNELLSEPPRLRALSEAALSESRRFTQQAFRNRFRSAVDEVLASPPRIRLREDCGLDFVEAVSGLDVRYVDGIGKRFFGKPVSWFRRKVTLPLEHSCIRVMARQQSTWNKLLLKEFRRLRQELRRLRARVAELEGGE